MEANISTKSSNSVARRLVGCVGNSHITCLSSIYFVNTIYPAPYRVDAEQVAVKVVLPLVPIESPTIQYNDPVLYRSFGEKPVYAVVYPETEPSTI